jgi:carboxymethylenebutenolidase
LGLIMVVVLTTLGVAPAQDTGAPPALRPVIDPAAIDLLADNITDKHSGRTIRKNEGESNEFAFYVAGPSDAGRHVVLFHTAFGLNDRMRSYADALGRLGFRAWAIDLFNGRSTSSRLRGYWLLDEANDEADRTRERIGAALAWLERATGDDPIVLLGFSFGARWAFEAVVLRPELFDGAILFYPYPVEDAAAITARLPVAPPPMLTVFGTEDDYVETATAAAWRAQLRERRVALRELTVEAGHAFMHPDLDTYEATIVRTAWRTALEFLADQTGAEEIAVQTSE